MRLKRIIFALHVFPCVVSPPVVGAKAPSPASNTLNLGLNVMVPSDTVEDLFAKLATELGTITAIGQIIEVKNEQ
jgi:hypothetical protein